MAIQALTDRLREPGTVLLDTILPDNLGHSSFLFERPHRIIQAATSAEVPGALEEAGAYVRSGRWVAGYVAYEAGYALEPRFNVRADGSLVWLGVYEHADRIPAEQMERWSGTSSADRFHLANPSLGVTRAEYLESLRRILDHIREGDVYQINYTTALHLSFEGDPVALYKQLRLRQPVAYAAYIQTESTTILSLSPELFFSREQDRVITRPMKGTARIGADENENRRLSEGLRNDPKNRAENLMIVDLLRNDLSICCEPGSVTVVEMFGVERYPTLFQMTSTVEGRLRSGMSYADLFRALFPSGSVTGAPKIRAMELIRDIEGGPRGVYCGAVGFMAPGAAATFNVAIRTITIEGSRATMGTGSGIVWDSEAEREYEECVLKTRFVLDSVTR